jgi:hypothetical protein
MIQYLAFIGGVFLVGFFCGVIFVTLFKGSD